jgi:hypothetical protein
LIVPIIINRTTGKLSMRADTRSLPSSGIPESLKSQ